MAHYQVNISYCLTVIVIAFIFKNILFNKIILGPKSPEFITNRLLCQLGEYLKTAALCINTKPLNLINIQMTGQFTTHVTVAMVAGLILAFPVITWEFWQFFKPAPQTKRVKVCQRGGFVCFRAVFHRSTFRILSCLHHFQSIF